MISDAIREARELKGISQKDLGNGSFLSYKTISAIETGRRPVTKENLKNICNELDDPRVYMEAISQICGDVFSVYWLDGKCADLHRASVKEKIIEELSEAIRAINLTKVYKNPACLNDEELKVVEKSIQETIDVYRAAALYIAVMCREFNLDIKEMFQIQTKKLIERRYLKEGRKFENR